MLSEGYLEHKGGGQKGRVYVQAANAIALGLHVSLIESNKQKTMLSERLSVYFFGRRLLDNFTIIWWLYAI